MGLRTLKASAVVAGAFAHLHSSAVFGRGLECFSFCCTPKPATQAVTPSKNRHLRLNGNGNHVKEKRSRMGFASG
jgi:hypothetical protein